MVNKLKIMQEHGLLLIENLVGNTIVEEAGRALEGAGGLSASERAVIERSRSLPGEARIAGRMLEEILFADATLLGNFLDDLVTYGELRAARRGVMDYLSAGTYRQ